MSLVHLHLLLNHVPVVGAAVVTALLILAIVQGRSSVSKIALGIAVAIGLVTLAVFFTGEPAEEAVEHLRGVSDALIERHEDAALLATIAATAYGILALGVLTWFRRRPLSRMVTGTCLAGALLLAAGMSWTANLGGQIRHTEIRADAGSVAEIDDGDRDR